jgi:hypothetical protein
MISNRAGERGRDARDNRSADAELDLAELARRLAHHRTRAEVLSNRNAPAGGVNGG